MGKRSSSGANNMNDGFIQFICPRKEAVSPILLPETTIKPSIMLLITSVRRVPFAPLMHLLFLEDLFSYTVFALEQGSSTQSYQVDTCIHLGSQLSTW